MVSKGLHSLSPGYITSFFLCFMFSIKGCRRSAPNLKPAHMYISFWLYIMFLKLFLISWINISNQDELLKWGWKSGFLSSLEKWEALGASIFAQQQLGLIASAFLDEASLFQLTTTSSCPSDVKAVSCATYQICFATFLLFIWTLENFEFPAIWYTFQLQPALFLSWTLLLYYSVTSMLLLRSGSCLMSLLLSLLTHTWSLFALGSSHYSSARLWESLFILLEQWNLPHFIVVDYLNSIFPI